MGLKEHGKISKQYPVRVIFNDSLGLEKLYLNKAQLFIVLMYVPVHTQNNTRLYYGTRRARIHVLVGYRQKMKTK